MHAVLFFRGQYGYGADGEQWTYEWADRSGMGVNRGVKRGQFPVEYRSILLVQDGPLACVSYS